MNFKCRSLTHTVLSMWGKIMIPINLQARIILSGEWIPMYRLWLHGLYGLYRHRCLLSPERPLNLITHSLLLFIRQSQAWLSLGLQMFHHITVDDYHMMTSSNGNLFRATEPLWGESTGDWWIPPTKASDAELWWFLWSAPEQTT